MNKNGIIPAGGSGTRTHLATIGMALVTALIKR